MNYYCKTCNTLCEATSFQEIVDNRKLCHAHLTASNSAMLRKNPIRKYKKAVVVKSWFCLNCANTISCDSKPFACDHCNGRSFKLKEMK